MEQQLKPSVLSTFFSY